MKKINIFPLFVLLLLFAFQGYSQKKQTTTLKTPPELLSKATQKSKKLRSSLIKLEEEFNNALQKGVSKNSFTSVQDLVLISKGNVRIEAVAKNSSAALIDKLKNEGGFDFDSYKRIVNAWFPIARISKLARIEELQFVKPVYYVGGDIGSVDSEGDAAMRADDARADFCVDGSGIRVGILSDTYTTAFPTGAASGVASGDLPGVGNPNGYTTPVTVVNDATGGIDEGRAMAEIVHDVAPGAQLFFSSALGGQATFANNINNLASVSNCDVIVDDIRYFEEPFYLDGIIAQACDNVFANGVSYFASAGNYAQSSYEAPFSLGGDATLPGLNFSDSHDFDPGAGFDDTQTITVNSGSRINLTLQWDDSWGSMTPNAAVTDLDLYLYSAGGTLIAQSTDNNVGGDPTEFLSIRAPGGGGTFSYQIVIRTMAGPNPSVLKWVIRNSNGLVVNEYASTTVNGQSTGYGHSNANGANAIGAAFWQNTPEFGQNPPLPEGFTSSGGVQIRYNTAGVAITPITRNKPNFTAPDGTSNTFFGNGNNFFGTSAAAPHAAAVAALALEADPTLSPTQIRNRMVNSSIDMLTPGFDFRTGSGLIQADNILQGVVSSLCNISGITVITPPNCTPDETYDVTVRVSYSKPPACNDMLSVNGQTFSATGGSFQDVTLTGLIPDGSNVSVTAFFENAIGCNLTVNNLFTAPNSPNITCPEDIVVDNDPGQCGALVNFSASETGSPSPAVTYSQNPGTVFPVGTTEVTATATSACGITTCQFSITVNDTESPAVNTMSTTVTLANGVATILPSDVDNLSTDNCGIASMSVSPNAFTCDDIGLNTVTLTATDINDNSASATATVNVVGIVPSCEITSIPSNDIYTGGVATTLYIGYGPPSTTLSAFASGGTSFSYNWSGNTTLLDNTTSSNPVFTPTVEGSETYTVTVTNEYGCSTTCDITIDVIDVRCGEKNDKVLICHKNQTLCISANAVPAHLSNHIDDYLGSCLSTETRGTSFEDELKIVAIPSPFGNNFLLKINTLSSAPIVVSIFDMTGKLLEKGNFSDPQNIPRLGSKLANGIYLVMVNQEGKMKTVKISKSN